MHTRQHEFGGKIVCRLRSSHSRFRRHRGRWFCAGSKLDDCIRLVERRCRLIRWSLNGVKPLEFSH